MLRWASSSTRLSGTLHHMHPIRRRTFLASLAAAAAAHPLAARAGGKGRQPGAAEPVASPIDALSTRLPLLARGINLSHWMWYPQAQGEAARRAFIAASDLKQLAGAGLTHVRLPFEPDGVWDAAEHRVRDRALQEYVDAAQLCLASGLAVIIDAHWSRTPWIKPGEATHETRMGELERMWAALALVCHGLDRERTFLEIVNEPHDIGAAAWAESQANIARAIRETAPDHTIIATGASWGSIDGLLALEPLDDSNVVYSFHFYEPHNFTHQGATWGFPPWKDMRDIPWPATRAELEAIADTFPAESRNTLRWSARDGSEDPWTAEALDARIELARQWSVTHNRPIYCGEFGAFRANAPRESRLAWTRALAGSLNKRSIGWAMWDYIGGFAIAEGKPGARSLDNELCDALGLPAR